ncbi:MAG: hypothetical protein WCF67_01090 [Chitinophagaceae bacterium]
MNDLVTGDGGNVEAHIFQPGSIWFDDQGIIRQFSLYYGDNQFGNYFLMPLQPDKEKYMSTISSDLAEFGIKIIANSFFSEGTLIVDLAKFLFEKYGKVAITDLMRGNSNVSMAYIAPDNNEIVLHGVLNIQSAVSLRYLNFFIRNDTQYAIPYETSRELVTWRAGTIRPGSTETICFANRQTLGYIRFYTGFTMGLTYEVKATGKYAIYWDVTRKLWSLSVLPN